MWEDEFDFCLFAHIFLADVYGVPFYDKGSVIVTVLIISWDFVFPPSLQERLAVNHNALSSTAYHYTAKHN